MNAVVYKILKGQAVVGFQELNFLSVKSELLAVNALGQREKAFKIDGREFIGVGFEEILHSHYAAINEGVKSVIEYLLYFLGGFLREIPLGIPVVNGSCGCPVRPAQLFL